MRLCCLDYAVSSLRKVSLLCFPHENNVISESFKLCLGPHIVCLEEVLQKYLALVSAKHVPSHWFPYIRVLPSDAGREGVTVAFRAKPKQSRRPELTPSWEKTWSRLSPAPQVLQDVSEFNINVR